VIARADGNDDGTKIDQNCFFVGGFFTEFAEFFLNAVAQFAELT
jgi:hypothetical protein